MDSDNFKLSSTPPDVIEQAKLAADALLPPKSKDRYIWEYENFMNWKCKRNASSLSEQVLMAYFLALSEKYQPSTLWLKYSMIKTMLKTKHNIDIKNYTQLCTFLKRKSEGYQSKKSKVLSADNVEKFINDAPDDQYLAMKVALIFGICGACRREELANITMSDIEAHGNMLLVKIPNTKNKIPRSFTVDGLFAEIVKKYQALRTTKGKSNRFFQNYQKGKCTTQVIGINKFGNMPKEIAIFLKLPNADCYTGHSFRRSSATLLADSGADIITLKRHGGWRSSNVAEGYIEDSINNKATVGKKITQAINLKSSSISNHHTISEPGPSTLNHLYSHNPSPPIFEEPELNHTKPCEVNNSLSQTLNLPSKTHNIITFNNCTNCNINYYMSK